MFKYDKMKMNEMVHQSGKQGLLNALPTVLWGNRDSGRSKRHTHKVKFNT